MNRLKTIFGLFSIILSYKINPKKYIRTNIQGFCNLFESIIECWDSVFQIDDVNLVPRAENVRLHLWVPVAALVSEMHSCAEHFLHIDGHVDTFSVGLGLHTPHLSTRFIKDRPGTQKNVSVHVRQ